MNENDRRYEEYLADVIPLPSAQPHNRSRNEREAELEERLTVRPEHTYQNCEHRRSSINASARTVTCRGCGVPLDPIDVLSQLARNREHEILAIHRNRQEIDWLTREVERLKREERNAKARTRRAHDRAGDSYALDLAADALAEKFANIRVYGHRRAADAARAVVEVYLGALEERHSETRSA